MYTVEEMEGYLDSAVIDYIKDHCYVKTFVTKQIKEIGTDNKGNKHYKSSNIYKKQLDKAKYESLVLQTFVSTILPDLEKETKKKDRKKREIGRNITQREFFETLFRDLFDHRKNETDGKGRKINVRSFLVNIDTDTKMVENKVATHSLQHLFSKIKKYEFFTPGMFISHQFFTKEMLTLLGVIVLDFDLDSQGIFMSKEELYHHIEETLKVPPAMIWDTKTRGNYQACLLIQPMTGTPASVHLYEQVVKEMNQKLKISDMACSQANHVFRIGKNDSRHQKFVRKYNENVYSINTFRWLLHERDERRRKEQASHNKVLDFSLQAVKRHPAVQALFEGQIVGWRDHACFTLALVMRFLGYSQDECENFILSEWQPKVDNRQEYGHAFTTREASKCVKNAFSDRYKSFHSKWIEIVTGIECDLKGYIRVPYQAKGIYVTDTEERIKEFLRQQDNFYEGKIQDFVEALSVKRRTVEEVLYKLRQAGDVEYQTKRGKGAKTVFRLTEEKQLQWETVIETNSIETIDEELLKIAELETAIAEVIAN